MKYFKWVWEHGKARSKWIWIVSTITWIVSTVVIIILCAYTYYVCFFARPGIVIPRAAGGMGVIVALCFIAGYTGYIYYNSDFRDDYGKAMKNE